MRSNPFTKPKESNVFAMGLGFGVLTHFGSMIKKHFWRNFSKNSSQRIISGIFAYPLDETWLGKQIDTKLIERLVDLQQKYGISPSGEGGEIETTVLDAPMFKKKIEILGLTIEAKGQ